MQCMSDISNYFFQRLLYFFRIKNYGHRNHYYEIKWIDKRSNYVAVVFEGKRNSV